MTLPRRKRTAIKALAAGLLLLSGACAWAGVAGTVRQLSGPLLAKKANGSVKVLALRSEVEEGDTLVAEKNTYALIKMIDNGEITLRPNSSFTIESYAYDKDKPEGDSATFTLVKGGLRSVTGLLGKRNKERFALKTPTATIGIRGTTFIAEWVEPSAEALASQQAYRMASMATLGMGADGVQPLQLAQATPGTPGGLAPGLYVQVLDGAIQLTNRGGSQNFAAGQFGYVGNVNRPPVIVPSNPGIKFTPPPSFSATSSGGTTTGASGQTSKAVDCEVR